MKYILVFVLMFFALKNALGTATGGLPEGKIPLYIRGLMSRESESAAKISGSVLEAAANHMNNLEGILDDYDIRFQWNQTQVRIEKLFPLGFDGHIILHGWIVRQCTGVISSWKFRSSQWQSSISTFFFLHCIAFFICFLPPLLSMMFTQSGVARNFRSVKNSITYNFIWHTSQTFTIMKCKRELCKLNS